MDKRGFHQNPNLGMVKCSCGQTFEYISKRDLNMKLRMHCKFCSNPPVGHEKIRLPKKSMTLEKIQHYGVEIIEKSTSNIYPRWIHITNSECNQEATLYP